MTRENAGEAYDLLIIPQLRQRHPAQRLTPQQFEQANDDWDKYGSPPGATNGHWTVAIAHIKDTGLRITTTIQIPRSVSEI